MAKMYKGFDKDLKCRDFQYEVGKTYETEEAEICSTGFHACEMPLNVFPYYKPGESRYCEVDLDANEQRDNDTKRVGNKITIKGEIGLAELIKAQFEYVNEKAESAQEKAATDDALSTAATSGNWSTAATSGDGSTAATSGKDSVAVAWGFKTKAMGAIGCYLVLSEFNDDGELVTARMAKVDGTDIKADTWYTLKDGEFVAVDEDCDE